MFELRKLHGLPGNCAELFGIEEVESFSKHHAARKESGKKKIKKDDQNAWDFRLDYWSLRLPKFIQVQLVIAGSKNI